LSPLKNSSEYLNLPLAETFKILDSSIAGLSDSEAERRSRQFGLNEVSQKPGNSVLAFLSRYWGPMPWLLEVAIILSYFLKHYLEAGIILGLLTINVIIGYIQSRGSQKALAALKKRLAVKASILRNGNWVIKETKVIVPGDIIAVGLGDIVPADAQLVSGQVSIDQSILTGESLPVDARQSAILYSGSIVKRGEAQCVVVNTGANTFFGKTAELVKIAKPRSHQEQIMLSVVRYMLLLGIIALIAVGSLAALIGSGILTVLTFAVIFLMGAVPVALPAVLTIVQSVGATELAKKGILVTRLDSIEDSASIDILCLDKTGTITQNKLSVGEIIPFSGFTPEDVLITAALASQKEGKDAIDAAIFENLKSLKIDVSAFEPVSFTPFEPATKRSEAIVTAGGQRLKVIKGAPQIVISLCPGLDAATKNSAQRSVEGLSLKGYRTLAVARSAADHIEAIQLVGLLSLADPPRSDSREMISGARELGVKTLMLTGDNLAIAREIGRQVAIGDNILRMDDFRRLTTAEQGETINKIDGLAEIYPEDKYQIVKILQSQGHLVGMTGDGVNDAPALKQAEMGIAVSSATDVAKSSASMVLTEAGIAVIIDAITTSRQIYQRMLTWVINKVTKVIQVIGLLTIGFFWFHDLVVSLLGMVLLIFANDFVTMSLATDNVRHTANPNQWNVKKITLASLLIGALLIIEGVLGLFIGQHYFHLDWDQLRTFTVLMLIFSSQFRVYIVRERKYFWSSIPGRELLFATLTALIVFSLLGVFGVFVTALTPYQVLFILGFTAIFTLAIDFPKKLAFKKFGL
jgi:H+-transporting ATPase